VKQAGDRCIISKELRGFGNYFRQYKTVSKPFLAVKTSFERPQKAKTSILRQKLSESGGIFYRPAPQNKKFVRFLNYRILSN